MAPPRQPVPAQEVAKADLFPVAGLNAATTADRLTRGLNRPRGSLWKQVEGWCEVRAGLALHWRLLRVERNSHFGIWILEPGASRQQPSSVLLPANLLLGWRRLWLVGKWWTSRSLRRFRFFRVSRAAAPIFLQRLSLAAQSREPRPAQALLFL